MPGVNLPVACTNSLRCPCFLQSSPTFRALFIRAPAVLDAGPGVEVLASYSLTEEERAAQERDSVIVAVRSGPLLATAFHPELTNDLRWCVLCTVQGPAADAVDNKSIGRSVVPGVLTVVVQSQRCC